MASGIHPSCVVCTNEFSSEHYPVILGGCLCADRICKICAEKMYLNTSSTNEKKCISGSHVISSIYPDRFFLKYVHHTESEASQPLEDHFFITPPTPTSSPAPTIVPLPPVPEHCSEKKKDDKIHRELIKQIDSNDPTILMPAFRELKKLADKGHLKSQCKVGLMYIKGNQVGTNLEKGAKLIQDAAKKKRCPFPLSFRNIVSIWNLLQPKYPLRSIFPKNSS